MSQALQLIRRIAVLIDQSLQLHEMIKQDELIQDPKSISLLGTPEHQLQLELVEQMLRSSTDLMNLGGRFNALIAYCGTHFICARLRWHFDPNKLKSWDDFYDSGVSDVADNHGMDWQRLYDMQERLSEWGRDGGNATNLVLLKLSLP